MENYAGRDLNKPNHIHWCTKQMTKKEFQTHTSIPKFLFWITFCLFIESCCWVLLFLNVKINFSFEKSTVISLRSPNKVLVTVPLRDNVKLSIKTHLIQKFVMLVEYTFITLRTKKFNIRHVAPSWKLVYELDGMKFELYI